jgi:hypothetical protein
MVTLWAPNAAASPSTWFCQVFTDWPTSSRTTKVSTAVPIRTTDSSGTSGSASGLPRTAMVRPWCSQMVRQRRQYTRYARR